MKRAAAVLGLSLVLAGCSGGSGETAPAALPPVTAAPSGPEATGPSTVSSPESAVPDAVEPQSADGAAAFVRRYVQLLNASILANDNGSLRKFSSPECSGCQRYIDSIADMAARHARVSGQGLSILNVVPSALQGSEVTVLLDFSTSEYLASAPDGSTIARIPPAEGLSATLRCVYGANSWTITEFALVSDDKVR